jgi:hypothetical protein
VTWCRPIAKLVSWLLPMAPIASVNKNPLYPEVQRHFDEDPLNFRGNVRARAAAGGVRQKHLHEYMGCCGCLCIIIDWALGDGVHVIVTKPVRQHCGAVHCLGTSCRSIVVCSCRVPQGDADDAASS